MKMNEQHYLPCPICGQSCKAEVALGYAEKSSVRNVVSFGHGFYGVDIGTLGDHPAVFIIPNEKPGPVGERVPLDLQLPLERELLPDDWTVLLFPTRERCKDVADALVGLKMVKWRNDTPSPPDPAQEPQAVALKPCAFCGGADLGVHQMPGQEMFWVSCHCCGLEAPSETGVTREQAVTYWNTRPVSLDREAVKTLSQYAYLFRDSLPPSDRAGRERVTKKIRKVLALIEGRT